MSVRAKRPASRTRRAPGRPRTGDDKQCREALLDAAVRVYAGRGHAAATQREIAEAAGVSPALANYYFGGPEQLLDAVVDERLAPILNEVQAGIGSLDRSAVDVASGLLRAIATVVEHHPWFPALWLRGLVSEDGVLRERMMQRVAPVPQALAKAFTAAEQRGELPAGVDPRLLVVSLIGLSLFPVAAESVWRKFFPARELGAGLLLQHTLALVDGSLRPDHEPAGRRKRRTS